MTKQLVHATFVTAPQPDEVGPLDRFEVGKTYQMMRRSLDRWISLGRAREATPYEVAAAYHAHDQAQATQATEIPEDWMKLPAQPMKDLAAKFTFDLVRTKPQAITVIKAEIARREAQQTNPPLV